MSKLKLSLEIEWVERAEEEKGPGLDDFYWQATVDDGINPPVQAGSWSIGGAADLAVSRYAKAMKYV